jgi:DNA primase
VFFEIHHAFTFDQGSLAASGTMMWSPFPPVLVKEVPTAYVATMTKAVRHGKIFVDYFRNHYTATAVADFSVRARPGAPVAIPLEWKELKGLKAASQFSIDDVIRRIRKKTPIRSGIR